ncbi:protein sidekick-2-like, partial [Ruditapes philippinarum]|uniref:protein sidekick-2-like n=1 Tax=Ruditapes philippinarum TaxID=129788 RepID=UPI00295BE6BC
FNATTCTLTGLDEFWTYLITVTASTDRGNTPVTFRVKTAEGIPSAAPSVDKLTPTEHAEVGFKISLNPPGERDINGIITNYTIRYAWKNDTCWNSDNGVMVEETRSTTNRSDYEVSNLRPYWFYNITVSASTNVGEGPVGWCDDCYFRTKSSKPGEIRNVKISTTSNDANITWEAPCETNGIITKYTINTTNTDPTSTLKHNMPRTWKNETDGNITQFIVKNLLPYRNYSFSIAAYTEKGVGNLSFGIKRRTDIAKPRPPINPKAKNINSTTIEVTWDTPDLFTGPTRYFVIPVDDKDNNIKLNSCEATDMGGSLDENLDLPSNFLGP